MSCAKTAVVAALLSVLAWPAFAGCIVPTFRFFPERNDNVMITAIIKRGTICVHKLGEGPGYHFTSVSPVLDPEHGSLSISGRVTITYQPNKSFDGKDAYGIRACATKTDGSHGCSNLYFVMITK